MQFVWDEHKNQSNIAKHGIDFRYADLIFSAPMRVVPDTRADYGEDRFVGIGLLNNRVVVLAFTEPDEETVRVISIRRALSHEQKQYEHFLRQLFG